VVLLPLLVGLLVVLPLLGDVARRRRADLVDHGDLEEADGHQDEERGGQRQPAREQPGELGPDEA
jgi:hypothetical protein